MRLTVVAAARPNFMKIAPIIRAIHKANEFEQKISYRLVHTGQHYDKKMSSDFFEQLNIPEPDINLECGGGSQAEQTAKIMVEFEKELIRHLPDAVLVVGDVTSTMACSITAKKMCIDVVHVEAGIRSGDNTMPEEINRIVTDSICDHFYTTSLNANEHLLKSGVSAERIHFVGNTMIDTLLFHLDNLKKPAFWDEERFASKSYYVTTLHRPSNVDDSVILKGILDSIVENTLDELIVFPVHPRTKQKLAEIGFNHKRILQVDPMSYLEFIYLVKDAKAVITDSGGITEETTVLGIPCLTLRNTTERPETITSGTNVLVGNGNEGLSFYLKRLQDNTWKKGRIPEMWDGRTSERIVQSLIKIYDKIAIKREHII